ncbi:MAG TPA: hypothetical protein VIK14_12270 [Ignavibacteria bacterium]
MKNKTITTNKNIIKGKRVRNFAHRENYKVKKTEINPVFAKLAEEGHEHFYNYLDWLGLEKDPDILVLTSSHHYYFENEDLKAIKTIVNLKQLNNIEKIADFLRTIYSVLPQKCYFVGCFTDNKKQFGIFSSSNKSRHRPEGRVARTERSVGQWNSFLNIVYNIIDLRTNRYMTEKTVRLLLEDTGLKILDITESNGLTYFCTQKDKSSAE